MIRSNRKRRPTKKNQVRPMLKYMSRLCVGMAGVTLVLAGAWWLNQAWSVEEWTIRGVSNPLETAIDIEMNAMKTTDFIHTLPSQLRDRLLSRLPDLDDVNIVRRLPDRLEIVARERVPIVLWLNADGKVSLVDEKGVPYRMLRREEHVDLPLLRTVKLDLNDAVKLILSMKQQHDAHYEHLSELIGEGDYWRLNFERGQSWLLPHGVHNSQRMREIIVLMQQKRWRGGRWRIDARMSERWFIRESKIGGMV